MKVHMPRINQATISGRLVKDPELFVTKTEKKHVVRFTLAVNERYKSKKDGQWKETTSYIPVVSWNGLAEAIHRNLKKGSGIVITESKLKSRTFETKDGHKPTVVELEARRAQFLTSDDTVADHAAESETPPDDHAEGDASSEQEAAAAEGV